MNHCLQKHPSVTTASILAQNFLLHKNIQASPPEKKAIEIDEVLQCTTDEEGIAFRVMNTELFSSLSLLSYSFGYALSQLSCILGWDIACIYRTAFHHLGLSDNEFPARFSGQS